MIKKYKNQQSTYLSKALLFYKEKQLKLILGYSWAKRKNKWKTDDKIGKSFGYFKKNDKLSTTRAFVLWRLKLDFTTPNRQRLRVG
ncbi:hypothetical protein RVS70_05320 [Virgibacillus sp. M23]|uniref:hypothetical protein n=1 Tax=Virgibacillus sp. M23 TaxID=3079030 RepID=UPI002A90D0CC|nr:hypothetical protein [Virgibacillus sp. M23]MDY7043621.1 hypothetical protein [Virgibacillus sp. M23]